MSITLLKVICAFVILRFGFSPNIPSSHRRFIRTFSILILMLLFYPNFENWIIESYWEDLISSDFPALNPTSLSNLLEFGRQFIPLGMIIILERHIFNRSTKYILTSIYVLKIIFAGIYYLIDVFPSISDPYFYSELVVEVMFIIVGKIALRKPLQYRRIGIIWAFTSPNIILLRSFSLDLVEMSVGSISEIGHLLLFSAIPHCIDFLLFIWLSRELMTNAHSQAIDFDYPPKNVIEKIPTD